MWRTNLRGNWNSRRHMAASSMEKRWGKTRSHTLPYQVVGKSLLCSTKNLGSCQKFFLRGHYFTYLKLCLKMCFLFWCSTLSVYSFLCFLRNLWKSLSTGSSSWWIVVKSPMGFKEVEAPSLSRDRLSMFQHHLSWCTVKNNKSFVCHEFFIISCRGYEWRSGTKSVYQRRCLTANELPLSTKVCLIDKRPSLTISPIDSELILA